MAENNNNPGAGNGDGKNKGGNGDGSDPTKNVNTTPATLDLSKVGDEDFAKIFDDPRLYKHPRFKSLGERAKQADAYEQQQADAENKRLEEQKKFQELAEKRKLEAGDWKNKYTQSLTDNKILAEAAKQGVVDPEAVLKLINRTDIKINDDGTITGVTEAVQALLKDKTYLKGTGSNVTIGGGTNPGTTTPVKRFKLSQLNDARFYREHEKEILEAQKAGQIENDLPNSGKI